ncbi:formyl transferase [Affinirhizobium pseudoryzae]|uniref:formyl transferase n=1 Tax=Allorhizobium pseudoryzae TaxID=379684 RepID=UPI0013ED6C4D|nr:formyl transferase [Allorhizobium pseudoryzae]
MRQDNTNAKLVVLTAGGQNPQVMINALARHFPNMAVIEERYESKSTLLKRRARRLGWLTALGQLATMIVSRFGKRVANRRTLEILASYGGSGEENPSIPVTRVSSLNDAQAHAAIAALQPDIVLTISCRLLTRATLAAIPCPVVNFHAGINPAYRGQMGGYWARVEREEENFGATLHLVDAGTDTGATLAEIRVKPAPDDTISTYPLLLTAAGTQATVEVLSNVLDRTAQPYSPSGRSVLRFPPPVWTYLFHGLSRNIW